VLCCTSIGASQETALPSGFTGTIAASRRVPFGMSSVLVSVISPLRTGPHSAPATFTVPLSGTSTTVTLRKP